MNSRPHPVDLSDLLAQRGWLRRLAGELVSDAHLREDLVQDTLCAALESPPKASNTSMLRGWLRRVLNHRAGQVRRRAATGNWHERSRARGQQFAVPVEQRLELEERLTRAIRHLRPNHQEAVVLRYLEELELAEMAPRLGISEAAVRQRVSRGVAELRVFLDAESEGQDQGADWRALCLALRFRPRVKRLPVDPRLLVAGSVAVCVPTVLWAQTRPGKGPFVDAAVTSEAAGIGRLALAAGNPAETLVRARQGVPGPAAAAQDPEPLSEAEHVAQGVETYLGSLAESGLFSGTALLAKEGEVLFQGAFGLANIESGEANHLDTRFKLMSVTKSVTAVAMLSFAETRGAGFLDTSVGDLLEPWPEEWRSVQVRHLLNHTSGLPFPELPLTMSYRETGKLGYALWPAAWERIQNEPLALQWEPGEKFAYSNVHYVLLATILDAQANPSYRGFLTSRILDPAGMQDTIHDDGSHPPGLAMGYFRGAQGEPDPSEQDMSAIQGAGELASTVGDLYRLDRALTEGELLTPETQARMTTPGLGGFGLGWRMRTVAGRACVEHTGGSNGFVANYMRFPDENACIVVLSNFAYAPIGRIGNDLTGLLFGEEIDWPQVQDEVSLNAFAGAYGSADAPESPLLVERSGSTLMLYTGFQRAGSIGGNLLVPLGNGRFSVPHSGEEFQFEELPDGEEFADSNPTVRIRGQANSPEYRRLPAPSLHWSGMEGQYEVEPTLGSKVWIEATEGIYRLHMDGYWPKSIDLIPLTPAVGYARVFASGGSRFQVVRSRGGKIAGFQWRDLSGVDYIATRIDEDG